MKTILKCIYKGPVWGLNRKITRTAKGMIVNHSKYTKFKESLAWTMKVAKLTHKDGSKENFEGEVALYLHIHTKHDIDAFEKCIQDALEMAYVIKDDKQIMEKHTYKLPPDADNTIEIEVLG